MIISKISRRNLFLIGILVAIAPSLFLSSTRKAESQNGTLAVMDERQAPNILLIVADDLGYSDIGVLGSEIKTPNIDRLAKRGTLFSRFYTAPTCSPTRAMLLTGVDNHLAGLGNMAETLDPQQIGKPGYEGYLNQSVASMAEIFSAANYQTYMAGKWHLGTEYDQSPFARGFQKTFALLGGGASHFADRVGQDLYRTVAYYRQNGELVDELPDDFFSSDYFTDTLIRFIKEGDKERPFLGYLSFTAPHWPLQAPSEDILAQRGNYSAGYDVIRQQRFQALKEAGLINQDAIQPEGTAPVWTSLSDEQRVRSERVMEVYAAMVENMDSNIGKLIDELETSGRLKNTIIVFLSDNGADGLEFEAVASDFAEWTNSFDNSLENIGHENSFVSYGRGWAHAGEAPHLGFKGLMTEGGIRSPMIMVAPMLINDQSGGQISRYAHPTAVRDILPTLLDFANIPNHGEQFGDRKVHPISGSSLRKAMTRSEFAVHGERAIGAELWNRRSVIIGDWKLIKNPTPQGEGKWKLYNLVEDSGESNDLSAEYPEIYRLLLEAYKTYAEENNIIEPTSPFRLVEPENPKPLK